MPSLRSGITSGLGLCIRPYRYARQLVRRYYKPKISMKPQNADFWFQRAAAMFHLQPCQTYVWPSKWVIIHFINSQYNFSIQNCPQNSDIVQLRFQSPKLCIIKHLKHTKLNSIEFLRTEMTSDLLTARILYFCLRDLTSFLSSKTQ